MRSAKFFFFLYALAASLSAGEIDNLLRIGAVDKALILAEKQKDSKDPQVHKEVISAFCQGKRPESALKLAENDDELEEASWAFITKGASASQIFHRWVALQLATDLHSYRSVPLILQALKDSNIALRQIASEMAASMQDSVLVRQLKTMIIHDTDSGVRLSALESLGQMSSKEMQSLMVQLLYEDESLTQEKIVAVAALASLRDRVEREELLFLVSSNRAIMRLFAIQLVRSSGQKERFMDLMPLAKDSHSFIKMALMETAVVLRVDERMNLGFLQEDNDYRVQITANWMMSSKSQLEKQLNSSNQKSRCLAAAALGKLGFTDILERYFDKEKDLFVRLNMAQGLLKDERTAKKGATALFEVLTSYSGPLMYSDEASPAFTLIMPSQLRRGEMIPERDRDIHDLLVRMELLKQLICKNSEQALDAMKSFLKEKRFGKATLASFVLLQEGDEETAESVEKLLLDDDEELRFQAAILLGTLFSDQKALGVLKDHYEKTDLETRLKILEALGRIGDKESLSFLKKQQENSSLLVQMLASWAIISILNH